MADAYWGLEPGFVNSNDPERMRVVLSVITSLLREGGHAKAAHFLDEKILGDDEITGH
jgi:hypothetical protein